MPVGGPVDAVGAAVAHIGGEGELLEGARGGRRVEAGGARGADDEAGRGGGDDEEVGADLKNDNILFSRGGNIKSVGCV